MFDLWWNHSVENQANARVFRIGQEKETFSVRVLVKDSVDEKIYELQKAKLQSLDNVFEAFQADKALGKEALFELLDWQIDEDEALGDEGSDDDIIDHGSDSDSDNSYRDD